MLHTCRAFLPVCYKLGSHSKSALGTLKQAEHFNVSGKYAYVWTKQTQTMSQLSSLIMAHKWQSPLPHPADMLLRNIANKKFSKAINSPFRPQGSCLSLPWHLHQKTDTFKLLGNFSFTGICGEISECMWKFVDFKGKSIQMQIKVSDIHTSWRNIRYHTIGNTKTTENRKVNFQTLFTFNGTPYVTDACDNQWAFCCLELA